MGFRSNATMLYGHIENNEDRVDHMLKLREVQDETGGFQTFIPLAFHPEIRRSIICRSLLDLLTFARLRWGV
jgi:2-iminoacetate synthase ThiH